MTIPFPYFNLFNISRLFEIREIKEKLGYHKYYVLYAPHEPLKIRNAELLLIGGRYIIIEYLIKLDIFVPSKVYENKKKIYG